MQDDGVIVVHSGVYDEQLSISKPVAIIGTGIEKTKIILNTILCTCNISFLLCIIRSQKY